MSMEDVQIAGESETQLRRNPPRRAAELNAATKALKGKALQKKKKNCDVPEIQNNQRERRAPGAGRPRKVKEELAAPVCASAHISAEEKPKGKEIDPNVCESRLRRNPRRAANVNYVRTQLMVPGGPRMANDDESAGSGSVSIADIDDKICENLKNLVLVNGKVSENVIPDEEKLRKPRGRARPKLNTAARNNEEEEEPNATSEKSKEGKTCKEESVNTCAENVGGGNRFGKDDTRGMAKLLGDSFAQRDT